MKRKGTKDLSYTQRVQLEAYLNAGLHKKQIAENLDVCLATVYNEIKRGAYTYKKYSYTDYWGERHYKSVVGYSPNIAEDKYRMNLTSHGAPLKIGNDYAFANYVEKRIIQDKVSPSAIVGEIKRGNLFRTKISKTTMYRYISQGIFLHVKMSHLPQGLRKKHYRKSVVKRPPKGTSIEKRPDEIAARNSFGNWEMDCVVGKQNTRSVLLVLTERLTRYEIIIRMQNRKADSVVKAIDKLERKYGTYKFRKLFKSITVDNGSEFSDFTGLERSVKKGRRTSVFYCHPYTSCERGSNERINRDIRRQCPKGSDFSLYSEKFIREVETWVNNYPREIFGFATSAEMFAREFAAL